MAHLPFYTLLYVALFFTLHAPYTSSVPTLHHRLLLHNRDDPARTDNDEFFDADMHALHLDNSDAITFSENREFGGREGNVEASNYKNESTEFRLSDSVSCDPTYGVMPCSDNVIGNLVLVAVYGLLLFFSAKMLSQGSELLLTVLDAGLIGGLLLPILGALPDSILILDTGVEVDDLSQYAARIMIISVIPYIIAQLPRIFDFSTNGNIPVLVAGILSLAGLFAYCLYQVFTPWLQQRRKEIARRNVMKFVAIEKLVKRGGDEKLVDKRGKLNKEYALSLFSLIDTNHDGMVSLKELGAMLNVSMKGDTGSDELIQQFMDEFDHDRDKNISQDEFLKGMQKWCKELKIQEKPLAEHRQHAEHELQGSDDDDDDDENTERGPPSKKQMIKKAVLLLVGGTIVAAVFADPLVDAVDAFSTASSIPTFFVSFILLPFASNSSEAVSSILFSSRKKKKNASLTYSQIYGAVTMNSTMGLGIFLAVVYSRSLVWDFSAEVLIIVLVTVIMGLMGSFRKVYPLWMSGLVLLLYPLSLGLVAILDYVAGWE